MNNWPLWFFPLENVNGRRKEITMTLTLLTLQYCDSEGHVSLSFDMLTRTIDHEGHLSSLTGSILVQHHPHIWLKIRRRTMNVKSTFLHSDLQRAVGFTESHFSHEIYEWIWKIKSIMSDKNHRPRDHGHGKRRCIRNARAFYRCSMIMQLNVFLLFHCVFLEVPRIFHDHGRSVRSISTANSWWILFTFIVINPSDLVIYVIYHRMESTLILVMYSQWPLFA